MWDKIVEQDNIAKKKREKVAKGTEEEGKEYLVCFVALIIHASINSWYHAQGTLINFELLIILNCAGSKYGSVRDACCPGPFDHEIQGKEEIVCTSAVY